MRSSLTFSLALVGLAAGVVSLYGCDSGSPGPAPIITGSGGSSAGTGGSGTGGSAQGTGGSGSGGDTGSGGSTGTGGSGTGGSPAGTGGVSGTGGTTPDGGMGGSDGGGGTGGAVMGNPITAVVRTTGCGKAPGPTGVQTIMTMGTKPAGCADSRCGPWMYNREYNVILPANYDNMKAYPLVFLGPGCGGGSGPPYNLENGVGGTVIRVGIRPPPNEIGHATNPGQGCFDDKEGDDSVDWVFYENLHDRLSSQFCIDKNRVFASGNSSGAWFSNEVACKYAGDAKYPIRAPMPNTGGLPTEARFVPTCTTAKMAGMWIHETGDSTNPFSGNINAINRALRVNGCATQTYANAMYDNFPVAGSAANTCRKLRCPEAPLYPLVVCPLVGNGHGSHDNVANPGFAAFIRQFSQGEFITQ